MPKLVGSLKARTIDATADSVLDGFSCGKEGKRCEKDVHSVIAQLRSGERTIPEVRATEEIPPGNLVGVTAIGKIIFQDPRLQHFSGSPYLTVIALSETYRGKDSRGTGPPLGDFLLIDALHRANAKHRGGVPWVFAFVDEANKPSCDLFRRYDFENIRPAPNPETDALFRRPMNLRLPSAR